MNVCTQLPLVVGRLRPRLERSVAATNEVRHEDARNGPGQADFVLWLFFSHLHKVDVALILVVADGRDAEICHISPPMLMAACHLGR
ncbi:hypothetical protein D3C87_1598110 [compost metagenome]